MESNNGTLIDDEDFNSDYEHDLIFGSLCLDAFVMDNHGDLSKLKFPRKMGKTLTFAHILESLYGWQN
jgi:hypothetical protein